MLYNTVSAISTTLACVHDVKFVLASYGQQAVNSPAVLVITLDWGFPFSFGILPFMFRPTLQGKDKGVKGQISNGSLSELPWWSCTITAPGTSSTTTIAL